MAAMEDNTGPVSREDRAGGAPGSGMRAPGGGERSEGAAGAGPRAPGGGERSEGAAGSGLRAPGGGERSEGAAGSGLRAPGGGERSEGAAGAGERSEGAAGSGVRAPGGGERSEGAAGSAGLSAPGGVDRTEDAAGSGMRAPGGGERSEGVAGVCRLKLFNKVLERSLKKFIDDASFQRFAKTFHPLYQKNPKVMETIHKQFIVDLQRTIQEDISRLVEEGELQYKLDELDRMEEAAKNNTEPAWRPSGVPEEDLCSFVMPYYLKQEAYLRKTLKALQAENAALAQRVQSGREAVASTELRITTAVDKWKETVKESRKLALSLCPAETFDV